MCYRQNIPETGRQQLPVFVSPILPGKWLAAGFAEAGKLCGLTSGDRCCQA